MFLASHFGERIQVTSVDNNPEIVELGKKHFGLDSTVVSVIADAYDYIQSSQEQFDLVLMDICYSEDNAGVSPPQKYLAADYLAKLRAMAPVVAVNTMIRAKKDRDALLKSFKAVKCSKYAAKCVDGDLNEVFMFSNKESADNKARVKALKELVQEYGLDSGVWLSKKAMKVLLHTDTMIAL